MSTEIFHCSLCDERVTDRKLLSEHYDHCAQQMKIAQVKEQIRKAKEGKGREKVAA